MVKILPATVEHCKALAPTLREMDIKECKAMSPDLSVLEILTEGVERAHKALAVVDEKDGCVAIFGVRKLDDSRCIPWMLASDLFFIKYRRRFIKEASGFASMLVDGFAFAFNFISLDNTVCQRWIKSLGFTVNYQEEYLVNGVTFVPFYYIRN